MDSKVSLLTGVLLVTVSAIAVTQTRAARQTASELAALRVESKRRDIPRYLPMAELPLIRDTTATAVLGGAQPLVVYRFNTTCPYCRQSLPYVEDLAARVTAGADVKFLAVSLDPRAATAAYVAQEEIEYPVATLTSARNVWLLGGITVPTVLVIDREGRVAYGRIGVLTAPAVDSIVAVTRGNGFVDP
jgi:peroxiredoxin